MSLPGVHPFVVRALAAFLALALIIGVLFSGVVPVRLALASNYPVVEATNTYQTNSTISSHNVNLPSGIQSGDLLILIFRAASAVTVSTDPTGWTPLSSRNSTGATYIWYREADGSEGSTVTVTTDSTIRAAANTYRISNWSGTPEAAFASTNVNNPPALSPSWGSDDTLWIAVMTNRRSDSSVTAAPTGYQDLITVAQSSSTGTTRDRVSSAWIDDTTDTEDPAAFSTTGTINTPHSATIAIQPAPIGPVSAPVRIMHLFEGFVIRFMSGRIIIGGG